MARVGALISPRKRQLLNQGREFERDKFNWTINLAGGRELDFWLKLRDYIRSTEAPSPPVIGILLAVDITLFIAVFVRAIVLNIEVDIFNILGLVDAICLCVPIMVVLYHILKSNNEMADHHDELAKLRYKCALEIETQEMTLEKQRKLETFMVLLDAAIYRLTTGDVKISILGVVVDSKLLIQLAGVMTGAAISGIGKLWNKATA